MNNELQVTFEPSGRKVFCLPGTILLEAAARAGHVIHTPCGGAGKCGKCLVRITAGNNSPAAPDEAKLLAPAAIEKGYRLACHAKIDAPITVEVPESSLYQNMHKILSNDSGSHIELKPAVRKVLLPANTLHNSHANSEIDRIRALTGHVSADLRMLRDIPEAIADPTTDLTATLRDNSLLALEKGDTRNACYGMAFDIGTTTMVGTLVHLPSGTERAVVSRINPQTSAGDDVISRIKRCRDSHNGTAELRSLVIHAINELIAEACAQASVNPADIHETVFAGNTAMQQILSGINPRGLGELPFAPVSRDTLTASAAEFGVQINPNARVTVFPNIGGFVGGDTVAGILATDTDATSDTVLLVDVGTNGEIVLAHNGRLTATSVAAGPAFEGARIVNGMRAASGAIEKTVIADNGDLRFNVIGNASPIGLCGTGLVDTVACLLRLGVIDSTGRVMGPDELPAGTPQAIRNRLIENNGQFDVLLTDAAESGTGAPVCLYQRDIRELQLANAAIRAGIAILLRLQNIGPADITHILLAGAFGNFIRRSNARRIGMLPQIPCAQILFVGNTASLGAKRVLLSTSERERADLIARATAHVDLSRDPHFQMEFSEAMLFPDSELADHCPEH